MITKNPMGLDRWVGQGVYYPYMTLLAQMGLGMSRGIAWGMSVLGISAPRKGRVSPHRLERERFVPGEYVSIREDDGRYHTFQVVSIKPI